jgi:hypothetical protein
MSNQLSNLVVNSYVLYVPEFMPLLDQSSFTVTLERRKQLEGDDKWAILKGSSVLYKDVLEFGYESMPSSRTEEDLNNSRFVSAQEALDFWKEKAEPKFDRKLRVWLQDLVEKGVIKAKSM